MQSAGLRGDQECGRSRQWDHSIGWRYVATEYVIGRPTFHVTCGGGDLWIDVDTRLILRSRGPVRNGTSSLFQARRERSR